MTKADLPDAILKVCIALAKHHIKNAIGDEALEIVATTLTDVGGEKVQAKVDSIFASKEGQQELLKAAKAADQSFRKKCQDEDLLELFTMDYGDLPSVQTAIAGLPEALDDESLRETLFAAFRGDAPKRINDDQIREGVSLYVECLQSALLPVENFGLRIIHNALKEIGKDVKDIKAKVRELLKKTDSQDAIDKKNPFARFLVPFPHNPDFVGRDVELASLHEMLQQGQSIVGIRPTVLVGLGGIGKTQLAVEYAHVYRNDYPSGVFWLNAINPLLFEFSDLAEKLGIADKDTPRDKAARKVWDYLESHTDSLVIFDNVLEPSELNIPFSPDLIPANLHCRTLFTTRQRDFPRNFQPFEVKVLPEIAAMRLLLRSRPEVLEEHHPEWGWARIVCASVGWLPLALELAAAYLGAYPEVSIAGYLERLHMEGRLETVDKSEVRAINLPTRVEEILKAAASGNLEQKHQVAVRATLQTQWKRLDDENARLLFRAAGQFPEASWIPIPRLGLLTGIESEAKTGRPSSLDIVLKKLQVVSLIEELSEGRLRLHPLVQEFAAKLSTDSLRLEMAERVDTQLSDLIRLQTRVIQYGVDMVLEDIRTGLSLCMEHPETKAYSHISKIERVLDSQAHGLRDWKVQEQPTFFFQQIRQTRNEGFAQGLGKWQVQAQTELARLRRPYLLERFPMRSDPAELRTLAGHSTTVTKVALSADGRLAVSASNDKTLKVWDIPTGRELRTLVGHRDFVSGVTLSADGRLAVSASEDETLKVWDVMTGRELRTLTGHSARVENVALSVDRQLAISASRDKTLKVWDVMTGRELRTLTGHSARVVNVALSADGRLAVSASDDKTLKVWDIPTGRELRMLVGHSGEVYGVALSRDGRLAVSAGEGAILKVWDVMTGHELHTLTGHRLRVHSVALSADGQLAVSASWDQTLKVWDVSEGRELYTLTGHSGEVRGIALSADGRLAVSASDDQTLKVWDITALHPFIRGEPFNTSIETRREVYTLAGHSSGVSNIALSMDGQLAVSATQDDIKVWEVSTGRELRTLTTQSRDLNFGLAVSADGQLAISASQDMTLKVWDIPTGRELRTLAGHSARVENVALSADGRLAVSASWDNTIKVWDVPTGLEIRSNKGHSSKLSVNHGIALSADGRLAVSASEDANFKVTLEVWDISTLLSQSEVETLNRDVAIVRELSAFSEHSGTVRGIALSADGRFAVSASDDQILIVCDVATGHKLCTLAGHRGEVYGVALSADGRLAASVSTDKTLKVWDIGSGRCTATLLVGTSLYKCAMSADGKIIVAGDLRGGIHFVELYGGIDQIKF